MTLLTALELVGNYPDNIQINSTQQENGKFAAFCYMTKDGQIHKLMLSTQPVFETEKAANDALHEIAVAMRKVFHNIAPNLRLDVVATKFNQKQ